MARPLSLSANKCALATLSAISAPIFAQSSVTISGAFDPSVQNQKVTYGDGKSVTNKFIGNNGQGTSNFTFKGVEDLGGGLKASFLLENDFNARYDAQGNEGVSSAGVRGINFGAGGGEQYLGLEGSFGALKVGAANTPSLSTQANRNPFGTKIGGGFNGVMGTAHVRSNNSIVYQSPVFNGITFGAAVGFEHNGQQIPATGDVAQANTNTGAPATSSTIGQNQTGITDIGVNYANGPFAAGFSLWTTNEVSLLASATTRAFTAPRVTQQNFYASYDLGVTKLFAGYHTEKQDAHTSLNNAATTGDVIAAGTAVTQRGTNAAGWNVGANVPINSELSLQANYGKLNDKLSQRAGFPLDKKITAIGMKYTLSKNTSIYAKYVVEENDNIAAASAASTWAVIPTVVSPTAARGSAGTNYLGGGNTTNSAAKIATTLVGIQMSF